MIRLLVCGGRAFANLELLQATLDAFRLEHPEMILICGFDPDDDRYQGADQLAYLWAVANRVPVFCFPARWDKFGRAAGPMRNSRMRDDGRPTHGFAFPTPGAENNGTRDMFAKMKAAGIQPVAVQ